MDSIFLLLSLGLVFWAFRGYRYSRPTYTPQPQEPERPLYQGHNRISGYYENQKYWMN